MNIYKLFIKLITIDSKISSKSFLLMWGAFIATLLIVMFGIMEFILIFNPEFTHKPDYFGYTTMLGGVATLVVAVVYGKLKGEQTYYNSVDNKNNNVRNTDINKDD